MSKRIYLFSHVIYYFVIYSIMIFMHVTYLRYSIMCWGKQRMLERAKARREKLDEQLTNAGHDVKKRRSPLKDANALLKQAAGNFLICSSPISFEYIIKCT